MFTQEELKQLLLIVQEHQDFIISDFEMTEVINAFEVKLQELTKD